MLQPEMMSLVNDPQSNIDISEHIRFLGNLDGKSDSMSLLSSKRFHFFDHELSSKNLASSVNSPHANIRTLGSHVSLTEPNFAAAAAAYPTPLALPWASDTTGILSFQLCQNDTSIGASSLRSDVAKQMPMHHDISTSAMNPKTSFNHQLGVITGGTHDSYGPVYPTANSSMIHAYHLSHGFYDVDGFSLHPADFDTSFSMAMGVPMSHAPVDAFQITLPSAVSADTSINNEPGALAVSMLELPDQSDWLNLLSPTSQAPSIPGKALKRGDASKRTKSKRAQRLSSSTVTKKTFVASHKPGETLGVLDTLEGTQRYAEMTALLPEGDCLQGGGAELGYKFADRSGRRGDVASGSSDSALRDSSGHFSKFDECGNVVAMQLHGQNFTDGIKIHQPALLETSGQNNDCSSHDSSNRQYCNSYHTTTSNRDANGISDMTSLLENSNEPLSEIFQSQSLTVQHDVSQPFSQPGELEFDTSTMQQCQMTTPVGDCMKTENDFLTHHKAAFGPVTPLSQARPADLVCVQTPGPIRNPSSHSTKKAAGGARGASRQGRRRKEERFGPPCEDTMMVVVPPLPASLTSIAVEAAAEAAAVVAAGGPIPSQGMHQALPRSMVNTGPKKPVRKRVRRCRTYTCPIEGCERVYKSGAGYRYHLQNWHPDLHNMRPFTSRSKPLQDVVYQCQACAKMYTSNAGLRYHLTHTPCGVVVTRGIFGLTTDLSGSKPHSLSGNHNHSEVESVFTRRDDNGLGDAATDANEEQPNLTALNSSCSSYAVSPCSLISSDSSTAIDVVTTTPSRLRNRQDVDTDRRESRFDDPESCGIMTPSTLMRSNSNFLSVIHGR
ncbi:hypothetical protein CAUPRSCDRAFT_10272 [Caulochytrium protostelioides]|uniref:C2H2-type domain-containing protein n=1 Tax=Caulochytrium protostelioides TaxID=1555241 RepID=A0A4P9X1P9_9FUNG|nr:hypothetical protein CAUPRSCDRAFT_10272 [Caulochytrium protostelioides]